MNIDEVRQGLTEIAALAARLLSQLDDPPPPKDAPANMGIIYIDFKQKKRIDAPHRNEPPAELTFGAWLLSWYERFKRPKLKRSTHDGYIFQIERHILPALGEVPLTEITGELLQDFFLGIPAGNTRTKIACLIRPALKKAVVTGHLMRNPFDAVELLPYEGAHYLPIEFEQQNVLLDALAEEPRYLSLFWVECCTGMRPGEFFALDYDKDVDRDRYELHVRHSMNRHGEITTTKTRSGRRVIPFMPELLPHLNRLKGYQQRGELPTYNAARLFFTRLYRKLRLKGLTLYSMRHTFISLCYMAGVPEKCIQLMAGHSKFETTINIYTHWLKSGDSMLFRYIKLLKTRFDT